jgi:hypothetical protein
MLPWKVVSTIKRRDEFQELNALLTHGLTHESFNSPEELSEDINACSLIGKEFFGLTQRECYPTS